ncbi:MAG: phosphoribosylglycinamide formyltransferase [Clostridiales Family XIII bacterium]|jgi:phosphoribosylglycinamide formyltransferase-1|nr:phosphoribosylglycinamide formyltransferase [Clostridiales Family XIII bacterium]
MLRISVLVSGGGTNLQAVIDAVSRGALPDAEIGLVISSRPDAYALERAKQAKIPTAVIAPANYESPSGMSRDMLDALGAAETDLIVLAGYMKVLPPEIIRAYPQRIINIHPSLIPKHCGRGYYGIRVHESVLAAGDAESGATVHYVDEGVDTGEIIVQERVPVLPGDTAGALAARVLEVEHRIVVQAIHTIIENKKKKQEDDEAAMIATIAFMNIM